MKLSTKAASDRESSEAFVEETMASPVRLMLMPVARKPGVEAISVSKFPFLITETDSALGRNKDQYPLDVRRTSRAHAVIRLRREGLYVVDLGSVTGTYVSGKRLDQESRLLEDGDVIAFGGDRLCYTVRLQEADLEESGAGAAPAPSDGPGAVSDDFPTTFVSSGTSFLDVFCAEDERAKSRTCAETGRRQKPGSGVIDALKSKRRRHAHGTGALSGHPGHALDDGVAVNRRYAWSGAGVITLTLLGAIAAYLLDSDRREIKELLDAGAYVESMAAGDRYLKDHPDDDEANAWALEALLKAQVPDWVEHIQQGEFDDAATRLAAGTRQSEHIHHAREMIATLSWTGRVEAHIADRGGPNAPTVILGDESHIEELVDQWNTAPIKYQQLLGQLATYVPSFAPVHARVLSDLRTLRNESALYGKAISELKSAIKHNIQEGRPEQIDSHIDDFAKKYPQVGGLKPLRADAVRYETLARYVAQKDLAEIRRFKRGSGFETPLFRELANGWLDRSLPPDEVLGRYEEAAKAWQVGDGELAVQLLASLSADPWGQVAVRQLEHCKRIARDYEALRTAKQGEDYRERLITFRTSLQPMTDEYFLRATEAEFNVFKQESRARQAESLSTARAQWDGYRSAGGIPGVLRVEDNVSDRFKSQAKRLSLAYAEIGKTAQIYQLIQDPPQTDWQQLREEIKEEAKRQRGWLEDLALVLPPSLLQRKLELLPQLEESGR
jgi:pSer/pThr/pTyr-binding forkhead associated (FHA) protein